jgi:hypothetical protein
VVQDLAAELTDKIDGGGWGGVGEHGPGGGELVTGGVERDAEAAAVGIDVGVGSARRR